jgi:hypothetical protein
MNWFPFVTNGVIGGTTGFCLMTIALLFRTRQVAKNGLYVDTKYIQQSPYLLVKTTKNLLLLWIDW